MPPRGLKPHTHEDRLIIAERLIPLLQRKFGDNLVAIAGCASFAREQDRDYSDLELLVFLKHSPGEDEDQYLQRVVDGLLIEAVYITKEAYLKRYQTLSSDWYLAGSAMLLPLYNETFVEDVLRQMKTIRHSKEQFIKLAAHRFLDVQESFAKLLNAIEHRQTEALGLLLFDAVLHMLATLSYLNQKSFTTFATFVTEARRFEIKPDEFDQLLDLIVMGQYWDVPSLRETLLAVFESSERIFAAQGFPLYDESIDPNLPNKRYE